MTQEEKIKEAKRLYKSANADQRYVLESLFPELKESEGEKIIKFISNELACLRATEITGSDRYEELTNAIAWLEKQGECEFDCPQNHQDVNRPNGCIVLEDFNDGEGFYKMHLDYLNKKQVEEIEEMVRAWNKEPKASNEDIKNCIGMCLTDVNEQRFNDYNTSLKDCLNWLEKQGWQKPADETKFKVGDWVVYCNDDVDLITGIEENGYCINNGGYIPFVCESDIRLWTIQDAKDGDVLVTGKKNIFIFKSIIGYTIYDYCGLFFGEFTEYPSTVNGTCAKQLPKDYVPATKEQRDQLEKAMADAGYTFDFEKKELKKIEQNPVIEMKTTEESLGVDSDTYNKIVDECVYGEQKSAWSEEDESHIRYLIECLEHCKKVVALTMTTSTSQEYINWLKSLKPQNTWKPSDEMLEALYRVIPENVMEKSEDEMLLDKLYQGLKYGRVLSEK